MRSRIAVSLSKAARNKGRRRENAELAGVSDSTAMTAMPMATIRISAMMTTTRTMVTPTMMITWTLWAVISFVVKSSSYQW